MAYMYRFIPTIAGAPKHAYYFVQFKLTNTKVESCYYFCVILYGKYKTRDGDYETQIVNEENVQAISSPKSPSKNC